jgi:hypothetical protein
MPDPSPPPAMGMTSGPDIVALFTQLNGKMDSLQGKIDGYAVKAVGLHKCLRHRRLSDCSAFHWEIRSYCTDANLIIDT